MEKLSKTKSLICFQRCGKTAKLIETLTGIVWPCGAVFYGDVTDWLARVITNLYAFSASNYGWTASWKGYGRFLDLAGNKWLLFSNFSACIIAQARFHFKCSILKDLHRNLQFSSINNKFLQVQINLDLENNVSCRLSISRSATHRSFFSPAHSFILSSLDLG